MLDLGASKMFINSRHVLELTELSDKVVAADGTELDSSNTALSLTHPLSKRAREAIAVQDMKQKELMSDSTLANNGYTTSPIFQGLQDCSGLWMVPIADNQDVSPELAVTKTAMNVYKLPSTKEVVRFLQAALGYPTNATLLTAAQNGNLVTFPGLMPENIN
eukprot:CCRYP_009147-RA/>CCRYP_009147-RA protein AED:0.43 eAED:0.43 QI:0/0/0/1/0/0/2/0/161